MKNDEPLPQYKYSVEDEFRKHAKNIFRYLVYRGASRGVAEELVQEAFIKLHEGKGTFTDDRSLQGWLYRVAENSLINHQNLASSRLEKNGEEANDEISGHSSSESDNRSLELNLDDCVTQQLEIFRSRSPLGALAVQMQLDSHSTAEIAVVLGKTDGATRKFLHDTKISLRPYLEQCKEFMS